MILKSRIDVYRKSGGVYPSSASFSVDNLETADTDVEIAATADTFTVVFGNAHNIHGALGAKFFEVDDKLRIYITASAAGITGATTPVFEGIVTRISHEVDAKKITVEGVNLLEKLLNALTLGAYTSSTASEIIQNLIEKVNDDIPDGQHISWYAGNSTTTEAISYYRRYMPVFQMIEELSRKETNLYGDFIYYLDLNNNFHWELKTTAPESLEYAEGTDFISLKAEKSVYDVVTALVADVGMDPYGRPITAIDYNINLAQEYGLRWGNAVQPVDRAGSLLRQCRACAIGGSNAGIYGPWTTLESAADPDKNLPSAADYAFNWGGGNTGFKFPWTSGATHKIGGTTYAKGATMYATTNAQFVAEIRYEARRLGKIYIKEVLRNSGIPRWKVDGAIQGSHWEQTMSSPSIGSLNNIVSKTFGWVGTGKKALRLKHVSHNISRRDGWVVKVHFEEESSLTTGA